MARVSALCLMLGLIAACGVSGTSRGDLILPRFPEASSAAKELVHEVMDALKGWTSGVTPDVGTFSDVTSSDDKYPFYILVKYVVRPSEQRSFVEKWLDLRHEVKEVKGNVEFTLSKTLTDNLVLYSYEVWDSKKDFLEFATSKAVKPLIEFIKEKDVALFITSLLPVGPHHHHHKGDDHHSLHRHYEIHHQHQHHHHHRGLAQEEALSALTSADDSAALSMFTNLQEGSSEGLASQTLARALEASGGARNITNVIILTKQVVRPSVAECFVKAFLADQEETSKEKGNIVNNLSKTLSDNLVFYGYSEWEGVKALQKHASSDHAKKYAKFIQEENIPTTITFLFPIENFDDVQK